MGALADPVYKAPAPVSKDPTLGITLPASVNLAQWTVPVGNQGNVGSCVTWAINYAMFGWYSKHAGKAVTQFAPMYTYSQIHWNNSADGGGSMPQDALNIANLQGDDTKADYFQGDLNFVTPPTAAERANAAHYKITGWDEVFNNPAHAGLGQSGIDALKIRLSNGQPVAIGFRTRQGFNLNLNAAHPVYNDTTTAVNGAHEVLAVGYDANGIYFQNSWGTAFGVGGFGWLSWPVVGLDVYSAHTVRGLAADGQVADTTPPVPAVPTAMLAGGTATNPNVLPVQLNWSASDASGINRYDMWLSVNGGNWVQQYNLSPLATSAVYNVQAGASIYVAVRAQDKAGNWSGFSVSPVIRLAVAQDTSTAIAYTSNAWYRATNSVYFGGTEAWTGTRLAAVSFRITGRSFMWYATRAANRGQAYIWIDGVYQGVLDTYSATVRYRSATYRYTWPTNGTHTIVIKAVGTTGRPYIDMDAVAVIY